jgi:hypothetical protein
VPLRGERGLLAWGRWWRGARAERPSQQCTGTLEWRRSRALPACVEHDILAGNVRA